MNEIKIWRRLPLDVGNKQIIWGSPPLHHHHQPTITFVGEGAKQKKENNRQKHNWYNLGGLICHLHLFAKTGNFQTLEFISYICRDVLMKSSTLIASLCWVEFILSFHKFLLPEMLTCVVSEIWNCNMLRTRFF